MICLSGLRHRTLFMTALLLISTSSPLAQNLAPAGTSGLPTDPKALMLQVARSNGLTGKDIKPWHLKVSFKVLDDNGNTTDQGTYEEFWISWTRHKSVFTEGASAQTYYGTPKGTLRSGARVPESDLLFWMAKEFFEPIPFPENEIKHLNFVIPKSDSDASNLLCLTVKDNGGRTQGGWLSPTYCVDKNLPIVRLGSHEFDSHRFVHNNISKFQGRYLPGDVEAFLGQKLVLKAHLDQVEVLNTINEADFTAPPDAVTLP